MRHTVNVYTASEFGPYFLIKIQVKLSENDLDLTTGTSVCVHSCKLLTAHF